MMTGALAFAAVLLFGGLGFTSYYCKAVTIQEKMVEVQVVKVKQVGKYLKVDIQDLSTGEIWEDEQTLLRRSQKDELPLKQPFIVTRVTKRMVNQTIEQKWIGRNWIVD